tara:strand:+ start:266 stop:466 length:201 start_codon:yes stop_codon:yes gene_type:complete
MKYITVLDYEAGRVFQYDVSKFGDDYVFIDPTTPQNEEIEDLIVDQGHRLSNCDWMISDDPQIITN